GRDRGIQLAQGSGGSIARIREARLAGLLTLVIELTKSLEAEKDFTANFDRHVLVQPKRNGSDRPHVAGYHFAGPAIASRDPFAQQPVLVNKGHTEPVYLELRHIVDLLSSRQLNHTACPILKLFLRIRVLQAEHRPRKRMGRKLFRRLSANALGRGIRRDQLRIFLLEPLKLAHKLVELVVGNNRLAEHVIAMLVFANLPAELLDPVVYGAFGATHASADFIASASVRGWSGTPCPASTRAISRNLRRDVPPRARPRRRERQLSYPSLGCIRQKACGTDFRYTHDRPRRSCFSCRAREHLSWRSRIDWIGNSSLSPVLLPDSRIAPVWRRPPPKYLPMLCTRSR